MVRVAIHLFRATPAGLRLLKSHPKEFPIIMPFYTTSKYITDIATNMGGGLVVDLGVRLLHDEVR